MEADSVFVNWPEVDEKARPREIYVMNVFPTVKELLELEAKGYVLVDVRTIPQEVQQVKAILQGFTEATIVPPHKAYLATLELRMKALGMTAAKQHQQTKDEKSLDTKSIDALLNSIDTRGRTRGGKNGGEGVGTHTNKGAAGKSDSPKNSGVKPKKRQTKALKTSTKGD